MPSARCSNPASTASSLTRAVSRPAGSVSPTSHRLADRDRDGAEGLRDLRAVPAPGRPVAIRLDVKRQDRMAGRAGEPHRARLRDARRTARAVDRERRRPPCRASSRRSCTSARAAAARRRAARGAEAEAVHDAARSTRRRSSGWSSRRCRGRGSRGGRQRCGRARARGSAAARTATIASQMLGADPPASGRSPHERPMSGDAAAAIAAALRRCGRASTEGLHALVLRALRRLRAAPSR